MTTLAIDQVRAPRPQPLRAAPGIPLGRLVRVELRKMFDTRSGFWLMASIGMVAVLATFGVIGFTPEGGLSHSAFVRAISVPMSLILPLVALLSVTSEWSQRSGLTTFALVPHRSRVVLAKAVSSVVVGVVAVALVLAVAALGNLAGAGLTSSAPVWDASVVEAAHVLLGSVLSLLTGFMLGLVVRASSGAIVAFLVYSVLLPMVFGLAVTQDSWFRDVQPWIDVQAAQGVLLLLQGSPSSEQWSHIAVTGVIWLVLPMAAGLRLVLRAEIK
jgi:hypothetical protein